MNASSDSQCLHVACAAEESYAVHSAAMIHSVVANAGGAVHVHYLHGPEFPGRAAERLARVCRRREAEISFHKIDPKDVDSLPVLDLFPSAMWYRIFLPELLPEADRVLYLDVDTLVVDSLQPLTSISLDGYYLAAVTNVFQPEHRHRPASLGLAGPESYFNSGVILMNLAAMRDDNCTSALRAFATSRGTTLEWPDQDALNVVLGEHRLPLHPRWNFMNSMRFPWSTEVFSTGELEEARRAPAVRHFEGPDENKPWHLHCERDNRELYRRYLRRTPWRMDALKASLPTSLRSRVRTLRGRLANQTS